MQKTDKTHMGEERGTPKMNDKGQIVHKHVPTAGIIVLTAVVFLIVGALVTGGIVLCLHVEHRLSTAQTTHEPTAVPTVTPLPTPTPTPTPAPTPTPTPAPNLSDVIDSVLGGVAVVNSYEGTIISEMGLISSGTGFFIDSSGYLVTNYHVIEGAKSITVEAFSGEKVRAELVGGDRYVDVAVLKVDPTKIEFTALQIGNSDAVHVGEFVFAIGNPSQDELNFTATYGMVGGLDRYVNMGGNVNRYIQTDAAINPGNSGGPLFDKNGLVIGVTTAKITVASYDEYGDPIIAEGLGFALPINDVMDIVNELMDTGEAQSPGLGLSVYEVTPERAELYSVPTGLLVHYVIDGGPAYIAGLRADDIITAVDGAAVATHEELRASFEGMEVGETLAVTYWRNGRTYACELTLGDRNSMGDTVYNNEYGGAIIGIEP